MTTLATHVSAEIASNHLNPGSALDGQNVGETERWLSLLGGGLLAAYGLREGGLSGLGLAAIGGSLLYRGMSGHCSLYHAMGVSTKEHSPAAAVAAGSGVKIIRSVTIQRTAEDLYRHWRNFDNLPRIMSHLVSVTTEGDRTHWVARAPVGMTVEWDAEIVNDDRNRLIAWRSLQGSQVATAGSVQFTPLGHGQGTEVLVTLKYDPPGGRLGSWLAWMFGQEPGQQISRDLSRFKQWMETGELVGAK